MEYFVFWATCNGDITLDKKSRIKNMTPSNNQKEVKSWVVNLKQILYQPEQPIDFNRYEHPTGNLATTFIKNTGEENAYVRF